MDEYRDLRNNARKFVIQALTEFSGKRPSEQAVETAVEHIVKAFANVVRDQESARAAVASQARITSR